jgi:hypothetical protein
MYSKLINVDIIYPKIKDPEGNDITTKYANMYSPLQQKNLHAYHLNAK